MHTEPIVWPKAIYKGSELGWIHDYLLELQSDLRDEFMDNFNTLEEAAHHETYYPLDSTLWDDPRYTENSDTTNPYGLMMRVTEAGLENASHNWLMKPIRYRKQHDLGNEKNKIITGNHDYIKRLHAVRKIIARLGDHCADTCYSIFKPNSVLRRHSAIRLMEENNSYFKYIRIHVPLIIPEGDVFLEVNGEEVRWADGIFGFYDDFLHSAHNYTNEYRLIFIVDVEREFLGLPKESEFDTRFQTDPKPFIRNGKIIEHYVIKTYND